MDEFFTLSISGFAIIQTIICLIIALMTIKISRRTHINAAVWIFCSISFWMAFLFFLIDAVNNVLKFQLNGTDIARLQIVVGVNAAVNLAMFILGYIGSFPGQKVLSRLPIKMVIFFIFIEQIVLVSMIWLYMLYPKAEAIFTNERILTLNAMAQSRAKNIDETINQIHNLILQPANNEDIITCVKTADSKEDHTCSNDELNKYQQLYAQLNYAVTDLTIVTKENKIIATTNPNTDITEKIDKVFLNELTITDFTFKIIPNANVDQTSILFGTTIKDSEGYWGIVLAKWNPQKMYTILSDRTGLQETGEVYLINKEKKLISPTRFDSEGILLRTIDNENTSTCIEDLNDIAANNVDEYTTSHTDHDLFFTNNIYNKPVVATHGYIPALNACIIAEISEREVLRFIQLNLLSSSLIAGIVVVGLMIFYIYISEHLWHIDETTVQTKSGIESISEM